ncbi:hypothetical protein MTP04_36720 [Lysinibacillus sp. PLM2]|nr:hypothetical protein MTP04_36720 [Lysinibacillus sp. PLM2]
MNNQEEIKMINRQIIISNIFVWLGVILVCLSFSYMVYIIWSNNYGSQFETLFSAITGFITILSFFVLFLQNNSKLKLDLQVLTASTEELPAFTQNQLDELEKIFDNVIEKKK